MRKDPAIGPSTREPLVSDQYYLEAVGPGSSSAEGGASTESFSDHLQVLLRRKWIVVALAVAGSAIGCLFTLRQTPRYRAETTVELRSARTGSSLLAANGSVDEDAPTNAPEQETQILVLESRALADHVRAKIGAKYPGRTYQTPEIFVKWGQFVTIPLPFGRNASTEQPSVDLKVEVVGHSRIILITCESSDPSYARDYANTLTEEYLNRDFENRGQSTDQIVSWLAEQLRETRNRLEGSENQLHGYAIDSQLVYTGAEQEGTTDQKKLKALQDSLAKATADRVIKESAWTAASASTPETVPENLRNERLTGYQSKLEELLGTEKDLSAVYTDQHPKILSLKSQIREVQGAIAREHQISLAAIRGEFEEALNLEKMLSSAYAAQLPAAAESDRKGIRYGVMKWDVDTNRKIYEELLQRVRAVSMGSTLQANSSVVLDPAGLPEEPFRPSIGRNIGAGLGSGLFLGVLLIFLLEASNRYFRTTGEMETFLGLPVLGAIPTRDSYTSEQPDAEWPKTIFPRTLLAGPKTSGENLAELVTLDGEPSIAAEAYKNTLASILLASSTKRPQVILVTSANHGEGKSTTVSNLGIVLAEISRRVLLIDADLRRPNLDKIFQVPNTWGLSTILRENTPLNDAPQSTLARSTSVDGLFLLPSGPGTTSIANLFHSGRILELLDRLRQDFDTIIIDTPPIAFLSDARLLGRVVDSAVLVVRAGVTTRDEAQAAKRRLGDDHIPLLGTILNAWDYGKVKSKYGYRYYDSLVYTKMDS